MNEQRVKRPVEYHFQHEWGVDAPSVTIVDAITEILDEERVDAESPLYDSVDVDALDHLFAPTSVLDRDQGLVTFWFADCRVTMHASGDVYVVPNDAVGDEPGASDE